MTGQDCGGTVNLLGKYDAGKMVRQGEAAQREEEVGAFAGLRGPAAGRAEGEHKALRSIVAEASKAGSELFRSELLAAAVEEDGVGADTAGLEGEPVEERSLTVE